MIEFLLGAVLSGFFFYLISGRVYKKKLNKVLQYNQTKVIQEAIKYSKIVYHVDAGRIHLTLQNPYAYDKVYQIPAAKLIKEFQAAGYRLPSSTVVKSTAPVSCWFILGMMPTKDQSKVKAAYRKMSMTYHPDQGGDVKAFQSLTTAYNTALSLCKK